MYCGECLGDITTGDTSLMYELVVYASNEPYEVQPIITPEWWRWYDIFRTWLEYKLPPLLTGVISLFKKRQSPVDVKQRNKQKRRMFVQKLRAT